MSRAQMATTALVAIIPGHSSRTFCTTIPNQIVSTINLNADTIDCESTPNPEGQVEALPSTDRETCIMGLVGLVTHAVVAISARDMSVSAVIGINPP